MENAAPELHKQADERVLDASAFDDDVADPFDAREVFDLIRDINDPEHPHTLEELNVVQLGSFCAGNAVCGAGRHAQAVKHTQTHTHTQTHRHTHTHRHRHTHTHRHTQTHTHRHRHRHTHRHKHKHTHTFFFWDSLFAEQIKVDDPGSLVHVQFTPTIPHCSMATLIGLCIRVRLLRSLPPRFKVDVEIFPGTHVSRDQGCIVCVCVSLCVDKSMFNPGFVSRLHSCRLSLGLFADCTVNKQLGDKERVAAALENQNLLQVVNQCLGV